MKIEFILKESLSNQEREYKSNCLKEIVQFLKELFDNNQAIDLFKIRYQGDKRRFYVLQSSTKNEKYNNQMSLMLSFIPANDFAFNCHGATYPKQFGTIKQRIKIDFGLTDDDSYNKERLYQEFPDMLSRLKEVIEHEFKHVRQFSDGSEIDQSINYLEQPEEIEAFSTGIIKKWKYDMNIHKTKNKGLEKLPNTEALFPHYLAVYMFSILGIKNLDEAFLFYDNIIKYISKNFPKMNLSKASDKRKDIPRIFNAWSS